MKIGTAFLFCFLVTTLFAQTGTLLFKVNDQYIFADTNGNIPLGKRFDYIYNTLYKTGEYIVRAKDKYAVVRNNTYIFPCEYDEIRGLEPVYGFNVYALERDRMNALATNDGVIHTGFEYMVIDEYDLEHSSENKGINNDGAFFRLLKEERKLQLMYVSRSNKSMLLVKETVDEIRNSHGLFLLKKGEQEALFEFDPATVSLKPVLPFGERSVDFLYDSYLVTNPKKNVTQVYSYEHRLLETFKGPMVYELISDDNEEVREDIVEAAAPEKPNLDYERSLLLKGRTGKIIKGFEASVLSSGFRQVNYRADLIVRGKKGNWTVDAEFGSSLQYLQNDTAFQVAADELITDQTVVQSLIIKRVGKLYGAIDSRGNEVFAPQFKSLEVVRSKDGTDWLLARDGNQSKLYYYSQFKKKTSLVLEGETMDQVEISQNIICVKRPAGKKTFQLKLVKWVDPNSFGEVIAFDRNEFFDSIIQDKSFSVFYHTVKNGKRGVISSSLASSMIPCIYDSIQLKAYYLPQPSDYLDGRTRYNLLQPIFSAYLNGKQHIYYPKDEYASTLVHSFEDGSLPATAKISDDGLFLVDKLSKYHDEVYSITGKKLTKDPMFLVTESSKFAYFTKGYWYLWGRNEQDQDILIGQNGVLFVLP